MTEPTDKFANNQTPSGARAGKSPDTGANAPSKAAGPDAEAGSKTDSKSEPTQRTKNRTKTKSGKSDKSGREESTGVDRPASNLNGAPREEPAAATQPPGITGDANVDPAEIAKFEHLASRWWDPEGDFKPLHDINPLRLGYIMSKVALAECDIVDIGCGGGILAESMARAGANVIATDVADGPLSVARLHALESRVAVDYRLTTAETLAASNGSRFDVVTCLEMLEHVPDIRSVVSACAALAKPGAHLFFSTINRHPKAYALAVLGAEYVLGILPRGTHDYEKFVTPAELCDAARHAGLTVQEIRGMSYNPFTRAAGLTSDVKVNYLVHATRD